jgi:chemotaxis protein methyltransferase CheR
VKDLTAAEIEALEIGLLLEAIHARYGYDLRGYAAASMRRRVLAALAHSGCRNLGELQHRLLQDHRFFAGVLDHLTVRVSEMFRDPAFFLAFRLQVAPMLRTYPLLNVWHSGCASGEEVYSMAILLSEEGLHDRVQIYATDLSAAALEQAKQGVYPAERMVVYPAERMVAYADNHQRSGGRGHLGDHFTEAYDRVAVKEALRRRVLFFEHDLVSDQVFAEMHVVLCRNVLIYFGGELRLEVLRKLGQSTRPGGFLCLGAGEQLPRPLRPLFAEFAGPDRIYRRLPPSAPAPAAQGVE